MWAGWPCLGVGESLSDPRGAPPVVVAGVCAVALALGFGLGRPEAQLASYGSAAHVVCPDTSSAVWGRAWVSEPVLCSGLSCCAVDGRSWTPWHGARELGGACWGPAWVSGLLLRAPRYGCYGCADEAAVWYHTYWHAVYGVYLSAAVARP